MTKKYIIIKQDTIKHLKDRFKHNNHNSLQTNIEVNFKGVRQKNVQLKVKTLNNRPRGKVKIFEELKINELIKGIKGKGEKETIMKKGNSKVLFYLRTPILLRKRLKNKNRLRQ